jgi:Transposase DDE domain group 1
VQQGVRKAIQQVPDDAWAPIPYWLEGGAGVAEASYRPFGKRGPAVRLIVRRVRPTPGSQLALDVVFDDHPFITNREGLTLELEADHRRHAEVEPAICDLKHGLGLEHLPSGRFAANAAWLALVGIAHNLARWTGRTGLGGQAVTAKTLRTRYLAIPGRLTVSARRPTLHLPARWRWRWRWQFALAGLRCIPDPT